MTQRRNTGERAPTAWWPRAIYPVAVALAALTVFHATLAPTVTAEDSGELIAAAWHCGVAHPPGYPLWSILCGVFMRLVPLGTIAWRANLFSAACSAAAAAVGYAAVRQLGISRAVAAAASLVWIWSRWSWSQSVIAEVYALNSLLTATVFWCGLRWFRTGSTRPLVGASLLMGLGMSNHHIIALSGLAVAVWILLLRPSLLLRWRLALACVTMFVVGLLPYAYLPLRATFRPPLNWGDPSTPRRFLEHVTRHQYGAVGPIKVVEPRSLRRLGPQLAYLAQSVRDDLTTPLAVLAVAGLAVAALRHRRVLLLVLLWLACTGLLFVVLANYDLDHTSRWAMRVFLIPVPLGLILPLAMLLQWVRDGVHRLVGGGRAAAAGLTALIVLAVPAVQVAAHWRQCNYARYWYAHDHARNLLACMLSDAMVFPSGDHNAFPLVYFVMVEGVRNDVLIADVYGYVSPELYADHPADSPESPAAWVINRARRPVYYTTKKAPPVDNARFVSAGLLYHLLPEGMPFSSAGLLERCTYRNLNQLSVLDFGARHIMTDFEFFHGLNALDHGDREAALEHFARAAEYAEGIKEAYNNIGSALGEHRLEHEALEYFEHAAALDRHYALPRWNLFRLLNGQGRWQETRRVLEEIIAANPDDDRAYAQMGCLLARRLNQPQQAVHFWNKSLQLNPHQPEVIKALNDVAP